MKTTYSGFQPHHVLLLSSKPEVFGYTQPLHRPGSPPFPYAPPSSLPSSSQIYFHTADEYSRLMCAFSPGDYRFEPNDHPLGSVIFEESLAYC